MKRLLLVAFFALLSVPSQAQQSDDAVWRDLMEQWAEQHEDDNVDDDLIELLQDCLDNPINLNDTASDRILMLPFLSDFQRLAIKAYIAQYGQMVALDELHFLNGFDTTVLRLLHAFATVEPVDNKDMSIGEMLRRGHSNLRFGTKTVIPRSRGYNEDIYAGDPYRLYFRYYFKYADRIAFQFSGDKDAGEALRFGAFDINGRTLRQYGLDYYGYHVMFNNFGRLRRLLLGKYNLQFGQGATLWSGSAPWMASNMPLRRYAQGIRPAGAFCEYGYLRGAAATVSLLPSYLSDALNLTVFYSNTNRDATLATSADTSSDADDFFQSLYQSGYHRTDNELKKKGMLTEHLVGCNIGFDTRHLQVGATAVATLFEQPIIPADYVYNTFAFTGKRNFNGGIDVTYRFRRLLLFGEASMALNDWARALHSTFGWLPIAAVGGMQMHFDANNMLSLAARHVSPTYHNFHANISGAGSSAQNSQGISLFFSGRLPFYINFQAFVDAYRYPWMRYRIYSPSWGSDTKLTISKEIARGTLLELLFRQRLTQRNSDGQLYYVEDCTRQQLQLSLDFKPTTVWRLLSRVVATRFDCDDHDSQFGFAMMQQAEWHGTLHGKPLSAAVRLTLFDVSGYDARIYAYENDLMYESAVPMLNGRGVRSFMVLRTDITDNIALAFKYAFALYPENETIGTGYDRISGPVRHELKIQMRLKF